MSSWFGGGSSSSGDSSASSSSYDNGDPAASFTSMGGSDFNDVGASIGSGAPMGSGANAEMALRMALQQEQQKAAIQQAINKLSELCWDKCVSRPDAQLSSSEQDCISKCAERYLDTSMFVAGRMQHQAQQRR